MAEPVSVDDGEKEELASTEDEDIVPFICNCAPPSFLSAAAATSSVAPHISGVKTVLDFVDGAVLDYP